MTHSEICPICNGRGWICKNYPAVPPCKDRIKCYGCGGCGWIEVRDQVPYPYYPPYPPYTITWDPWYQYLWTQDEKGNWIQQTIKISYSLQFQGNEK